jgi:hypothetical protein
MARRRTTYTKKGKKVMFHLESAVAFQIYFKCANFSFPFCGCCRFSKRECKIVGSLY